MSLHLVSCHGRAKSSSSGKLARSVVQALLTKSSIRVACCRPQYLAMLFTPIFDGPHHSFVVNISYITFSLERQGSTTKEIVAYDVYSALRVCQYVSFVQTLCAGLLTGLSFWDGFCMPDWLPSQHLLTQSANWCSEMVQGAGQMSSITTSSPIPDMQQFRLARADCKPYCMMMAS